MSSAVSTLPPSWPETVPRMFRSAAESIEGHRGRLRGDPAALQTAARTWRAEADTLDAMWRRVRGGFLAVRSGGTGESADDRWLGRTADTAAVRTATLVSELATAATSLRFAAHGALLAAASLRERAPAADESIRRYVEQLTIMHRYVQSLPATLHPDERTRAVNWLVTEGTKLGGRTLQEVYDQTVHYDRVLASIPGRFVLGPDAPWREEIAAVVARMLEASGGSSTTVNSIRYSREDGAVIRVLADGSVAVHLTDQARLGLFGRHGPKVSLDQLPTIVKNILSRHYVEAELAGVGGYSLAYHFPSEAEARDFVDHLAGRTPGEKLLRFGQSLLGNAVVGHELGPWFSAHTGRDPDEITYTVGFMAKARGDIGVWPLAAVTGEAAVPVTVSLTPLDDGGTEVKERLAPTFRLTGGVLGIGGHTGSGADISEGSSAFTGPAMTVRYDAAGEPTELTMEQSATSELVYEGGTRGIYTGVSEVPKTGGLLPKGAHVKGLVESMVIETDSRTINLAEDPEALAAFNAAQAERLGGERRGRAYDELVRIMAERAVLTHKENVVSVKDWTASVGLGVLGNTWGLKGYTYQGEQTLQLLESGYVDPTQSPDVPSGRLGAPGIPFQFRPLPIDPHTTDGGLLDVQPAQPGPTNTTG